MSRLDEQIIEWFDANEPENRLALYREKLERLPEVSKLGEDRLEVFTQHIRTSLDLAEKRIGAGANWHEIQGLLEEARQGLLNAIYEPMVKRDSDRQKGTHKPRFPECDEWMDGQLRRNPDAKSPALWRHAPDWITDRIAYDRFAKRVTAARKRIK